MSGLTFSRRIGPAADVDELAYVIALHQTSPQTRSNATVSSTDIRRLLRSRHGLSIDREQALDLVYEFAGGDPLVDVVKQRKQWRAATGGGAVPFLPRKSKGEAAGKSPSLAQSPSVTADVEVSSSPASSDLEDSMKASTATSKYQVQEAYLE